MKTVTAGTKINPSPFGAHLMRRFHGAIWGCAIVIGLVAAGTANAAPIIQTFAWTTGDVTEGGKITYTDLGSNRLEILFDNTSTAWNGVITGIVFNVTQDINNAVISEFADGNGVPITDWTISFDVSSNISPGNTTFDITFLNQGIHSGIYNAKVATNFDNVVPDVARLVIDVSDPLPWSLSAIGDDSILRMQRTGLNGEGSLKISVAETEGDDGGAQIPEPATLVLLGAGLLGLVGIRRRLRGLSHSA